MIFSVHRTLHGYDGCSNEGVGDLGENTLMLCLIAIIPHIHRKGVCWLFRYHPWNFNLQVYHIIVSLRFFLVIHFP